MGMTSCPDTLTCDCECGKCKKGEGHCYVHPDCHMNCRPGS